VTTSNSCVSAVVSVDDPWSPQMPQWAIATRSRRGESICGDRGLVLRIPCGVLFSAIDGLGHGPDAAVAARAAATAVQQGAAHTGSDLIATLRKCHVALRATRGAAITVAFLSLASNTLTWLGVGNVEGRILGPAYRDSAPGRSLAPLRGLAGRDLPTLRVATTSVRRGDIVALATDGVDTGFADRLEPAGAPAAIADRILAEHWDGNDDALVVIVRWLGATSDGDS